MLKTTRTFEDARLQILIGTNHVRAQIGDIRFTSRLIDRRFLEYVRVIPESGALRPGVNVLTFALVGERASNNFIAENGIRDTSKWLACVWVVPTAAKADHNANGDNAG